MPYQIKRFLQENVDSDFVFCITVRFLYLLVVVVNFVIYTCQLWVVVDGLFYSFISFIFHLFYLFILFILSLLKFFAQAFQSVCYDVLYCF